MDQLAGDRTDGGDGDPHANCRERISISRGSEAICASHVIIPCNAIQLHVKSVARRNWQKLFRKILLTSDLLHSAAVLLAVDMVASREKKENHLLDKSTKSFHCHDRTRRVNVFNSEEQENKSSEAQVVILSSLTD